MDQSILLVATLTSAQPVLFALRLCFAALPCGSAAAHSGKPPAYRPGFFFLSRGYASDSRSAEAEPPEFLGWRDGKPEAYRYVLRQSRASFIATRLAYRYVLWQSATRSTQLDWLTAMCCGRAPRLGVICGSQSDFHSICLYAPRSSMIT